MLRFLQDLDGNISYYAACVHREDYPNENHYYRSFQVGHQIDLDFLGELLVHPRPQPPNIASSCTCHEATSTRLKHCSMLASLTTSRASSADTTFQAAHHPSGSGALVQVPCSVQFHLLVPNDHQTTPYLIWSSHGIHSHLAPPPHQAPEELVRQLQEVVSRATSIDTTRGKITS